MQNVKWWESSKEAVGDDLIETVNSLIQEQNYRTEMNIKHARLYGNMDILGLSAFEYTRSNSQDLDNKVTMNVIQSCVDTSESKIASKRPEPMFLTEAGDFDAQTKAKKLNKFVNGMFYDQGVYEKAALCFKDSAVFGSGLFHVYSENQRIQAERVFPNELIVDEEDAFYGNPQCKYRYKSIDRGVIKAAFPKFESQIDSAPTMRDQYTAIPTRFSNRIQIVESWKLPIMGEKNGKPVVLKEGRHILAIQGATLLDEPWTREGFPFAKLGYNPRLYGYWDQGIAEILVGKQIEINKILRNIQLAQYFCSTPIWMKEVGSKVLDSHLNNRIGNIVTFKGIAPQLQTFRSVNPEMYQHLMWLINNCYEEVGISQLAAQSKNPLGANASGKALLTFNDFETERFSRVGQRWEQFHMDIAKLMIEEAKSLHKNDKVNLSVKAESGAFVETIKFSDISLEESKYVMKVWPVSAFSSTPAAKLQEITEGMQAGLFDADTAMDLLDFPDLENKISLRTSKKKLVEKIYEKMVDTAEYMPAEPFMDLAYAIDYGQNYYCMCKMNEVPDDRLELIRRFMSQAEIILAAPQLEEGEDFTEAETQPFEDDASDVDMAGDMAGDMAQEEMLLEGV